MATNIDLAGNALYLQTLATGYSTAGNISTTIASASGGVATPAITVGPLGIYYGSGAPSSLTASTGSIYLNTGGSSVSTRMYINTTGASTWTAVTTLG